MKKHRMVGADWIARVRQRLTMTQVQFATFFDVHPVTISKWERDILEPNPFHVNLLHVFNRAYLNDVEIGTKVLKEQAQHGLVHSFFLLLKCAEKEPTNFFFHD